MFCPAAFREDRPAVLRALIRAHPLATLVTHGAAGLSASLVPFMLVEQAEGPDLLRAHLAKANDQLADLGRGGEALILFQGAQAYITPSWYPTKRQHGRAVPTWNYIAVEARGRPRTIDDAGWLRTQIDDLTAQQERDRAEPWAVADAPPPFVAGLIRGIVGVEIPIDRIVGKWKVSQNQPEGNRAGVAAGLREGEPRSAMADIVDAPSAL